MIHKNIDKINYYLHLKVYINNTNMYMIYYYPNRIKLIFNN